MAGSCLEVNQPSKTVSGCAKRRMATRRSWTTSASRDCRVFRACRDNPSKSRFTRSEADFWALAMSGMLRNCNYTALGVCTTAAAYERWSPRWRAKVRND